MPKNPMISLQATLLPCNGKEYSDRVEVLRAFQNGDTFNHVLMGRETPCSIWDYVEGDMVKIKYAVNKAVFYRVTKIDISVRRAKDEL